MMLALVGGALAESMKGLRGTCPGCSATVIAKCGPIMTPHWAHEVTADCDAWAEPESEWHRGWKRTFATLAEAAVEVPIGNHRADVVTRRGVIELQRSPIGALEARERERHYGRMVWLFDMTDPTRWERVHFGKRGFWWKRGARTQTTLRRRVLWDTPEGVALVQLAGIVTDSGSTRVVGKVVQRWDVPGFVRWAS